MDYMFERMEKLERREKRHFVFLIVLIALVIVLNNGKTAWQNVKDAQQSTNGVSTKALLEASGATPTSAVLMTVLAMETPDEGGKVGAYDFPGSNLAVTKVNGNDCDFIVVVGCHGGDSITDLEARFRSLVVASGELTQAKFSLKLSPIVDPDDDQSVAEFENGKLVFSHSSIRMLVPESVPVIIVNGDGEVVFRGQMGDEENSLPTLPPSVENDEETHIFA